MKNNLPAYPSIPHLPWEKTSKGRGIAVTKKEAEIIFDSTARIEITEKIDGANCAIALIDEHPIIRSRKNLLRKGNTKNSPASKQFSNIWNWFYKNKKSFQKLGKLAGPVGVYGEWMVAQHGLFYDKLPSWFIAYDLYSLSKQQFFDPEIAREYLTECGFELVPQLYFTPIDGTITSYEQLESLTEKETPFASEKKREGIVLKVSNGKWITSCFKMVREDFKQGSLWSNNQIQKNLIR